MKKTICLLVYVLTFFVMYFTLSLFGCMFNDWNYKGVLESVHWFTIYSIFLGWWIALLPVLDCEDLFTSKIK
jgi:hypothetical protein